jgi:hypothetical protein
MYADVDRKGLPCKKATRLLGSGAWLRDVVRKCDGGHSHGKPLRGQRVKAAGAYLSEFCDLLAPAYKSSCMTAGLSVASGYLAGGVCCKHRVPL